MAINLSQGKKNSPSLTTFHFLQEKRVIPAEIQFQQTKNQQFRYKPTFNLISWYRNKQKQLLINKNYVIYYGTLSKQGIPNYTNSKYKSMTNLQKIRQTNQQTFKEDAMMIYEDGSFYFGEFVNAKPQGFGCITNRSVSFLYKGIFKNGLPNGLGIQNIGQTYYEGQFKNGKKNGKGKIVYGDNKWFEGNFEDNNLNGQGKYRLKNILWRGAWKDGCLEGQGHQTIYQNEEDDEKKIFYSEYVGNFKKGERDGFGRYRWGKGYEYEGYFEKGQLNGSGNFKFKNKTYEGKWKDGLELVIDEVGDTSRYSLKSSQKVSRLLKFQNNLM